MHFIFLFIYTCPFISQQKKLSSFAHWYTYPYFHQGWSVYVPPPNTNYKLFAEFENKGKRKTIDLIREITHQHQSNRLKGYEPLLLAFSGCIYSFEKSTETTGSAGNNHYFQLLEHASRNYLKNFHKAGINKPKLILLVEEINSKTKKIYYN